MSLRYLHSVLLILLLGSSSVQAFGGLPLGSVPEFPPAVHLRAAVLTNTVPLAWYEENYTLDNPDTEEPFPEYRGIQADILREFIKIAKDLDNVTLTFDLEQAPPFSYAPQFEYLANDCGYTANQFTNNEVLSEEDCNRLDLVVGDYYGYPTRSIRTLLTPSFLTTAGSTLQYIYRQKRVITTLQEAQMLQEPVCLLDDSHFDRTTLELYPDLVVQRCSNHDECLRLLKDDTCALFVEDRLQLRYFTTLDATLQVTPESFNENLIVWPISARLDPLIQQLLIRWMYQAKVTGILDDLEKKYFSIHYCPLGKAGENCDQPCDASHGTSDRYGICVCESTRWTGEDCSVEVLEDKNLIPSTLKIVSYVMIGINFLAVAICAGWLYWNRNTSQVKVAQPLFLGLVLLGCLISTSTIFALAAEDDGNHGHGEAEVSACMAIPWLYSVGFSITFGSLFAKIRRVYLLFKAAATMQRVTVTTKETFLIVGGVLLIDVTILTVWTALDPLQWYREPITMDKYGYALSSEGYCWSDHFAIFGSIIAAFHFCIMGVACYLCYVAREIPTQFSEGKYVTVAMVSNMQIFVVAIPVLIILGQDPQTSFFVRSVIIWMNDLVVLALIFGNLMFSARDDSHLRNSKMMIRQAMSTYQDRRNKRKSTMPGNSNHGGSTHSRLNMGVGGFIPSPSLVAYGKQLSDSEFAESTTDFNFQSAHHGSQDKTTPTLGSLDELKESDESDDSFHDDNEARDPESPAVPPSSRDRQNLRCSSRRVAIMPVPSKPQMADFSGDTMDPTESSLDERGIRSSGGNPPPWDETSDEDEADGDDDDNRDSQSTVPSGSTPYGMSRCASERVQYSKYLRHERRPSLT